VLSDVVIITVLTWPYVAGSAAIEHKIYSGPFSKKFPAADVWRGSPRYDCPAKAAAFTAL